MNSKKVYVLAHNIRSMHNVGSLFRTADGAGVTKIYLTGYTPCPPRKDISKTALGAEQALPWEYHADPIALLQKLKKRGVSLIALERTNGSRNITGFKAPHSFCLIIGNEVEGVEPSTLKLADHVVSIPMHGEKESLNVSVAFGIAIYFLKYKSFASK
ncbi:MAG: RNA methyltransferase [Candidatus Peregrinibacteria bacterium]